MLKTHMAACLVASALVATPALAQTDRPTASGSGSTTSGSPAMQPGGSGTSGGGMSGGAAGGSGMSGGTAGTTAPGGTGMGSSSGSSGSTMGSSGDSPGSAMGAGSSGSGMASTGGTSGTRKPLASPQPGHIMGSDLRGTRVYGSNNESVGDISDIMIDRDGAVSAVIVGVGGFLGIGQKDVAVPFQALEFLAQGAPQGSGTGGGPATTGTTGTTGSGTGTMTPDRVVLRTMTRADIEAAPSFNARGQASSSGTSGTSGTSSAPRQ